MTFNNIAKALEQNHNVRTVLFIPETFQFHILLIILKSNLFQNIQMTFKSNKVQSHKVCKMEIKWIVI